MKKSRSVHKEPCRVGCHDDKAARWVNTHDRLLTHWQILFPLFHMSAQRHANLCAMWQERKAGYVRSRNCAQMWLHSGKHQRMFTCARAAFGLSDGSGHRSLRRVEQAWVTEKERTDGSWGAEGQRGRGDNCWIQRRKGNLNLHVSVHICVYVFRHCVRSTSFR